MSSPTPTIRVAECAARFAERYGGAEPFYTPMNKPLLNAVYCGEDGRWPPALMGDEGLVVLTRQLARGIVRTQRAVVEMVEDPIFVHVEGRLRWLEDSLQLVHRLRSEGLPLVGYTWWPLFSLLDWAYREGEKPPEDYLWHMGMYDLEPDGRGGFTRMETPVVSAFRAATERMSGR